MARSSMQALIARVRLLTNDTLLQGAGQVFSDDDIQNVLDEAREDIVNQALIAKPTYSGGTIQFLHYYSELGGWEDDFVLKQYLITTVTPSVFEPIAAHWTFSASTLPPVYITGKLYDIYRSAADLLERWAAKWALRYDAGVDGQTLRRGQVTTALQALAKTYRRQQRPRIMNVPRSDFVGANQLANVSLKATELDRMASGNGS